MLLAAVWERAGDGGFQRLEHRPSCSWTVLLVSAAESWTIGLHCSVAEGQQHSLTSHDPCLLVLTILICCPRALICLQVRAFLQTLFPGSQGSPSSRLCLPHTPHTPCHEAGTALKEMRKQQLPRAPPPAHMQCKWGRAHPLLLETQRVSVFSLLKIRAMIGLGMEPGELTEIFSFSLQRSVGSFSSTTLRW